MKEEVVNCSNCKRCEGKKVNKTSTLYYCKLDKACFRYNQSQVNSDLPCYQNKRIIKDGQNIK